MAQINKPSDYFNTKLYTGTGSSNSVTGVGFQPDLTWIKSRTSTESHRVFDAVRGATKHIVTNDSSAESTDATGLTSFNTDGFSLSTGNPVNANSQNFASWNWKANGAGVANTDGSISSTVSASATSGFSIVSYTGTGSNATIGHGLGATPQVVLIKELNGTNNWLMSHQPLSASLGDYSRFMTFNSASAVSGAGNVVFQNSAFTSSVFNVGTSAGSNGSGQNYIAYCFADVKGYSKFGIYNGVGSFPSNVTNFIYTGFKPAFIILKQTAGESWNIVDNKRAYEYNPTGYFLYASGSNTESTNTTYSEMDLLSNGFCLRKAHGQYNESGQTFIYMAFAEQPLVGTNDIPATAR